MSDTNFDYKKYLDNNPLLAEADTTPRKVTPLANVAAGDIATRFDDKEFTVITTGTLADLERYDVEKVTKDIDPDTEAIAVEDPNTGYAVYTYDLGGAVVFEEEPQAIKETLDDEVFAMAEKMVEMMGAEAVVDAIVRAMSTDDAKLYLGGIMRDYGMLNEEKKEVNEVQDRTDALDKLKDMLEDLKYMSREANELLSSYFPDAHTQAEAYGALDFGTSSNKYDTTLEKIIDGIERGIYMD